jgi:dihydroorotate dehydrogenase
VAGLRFPNRIGLAAGLDKNGRCIDGLGAMGFGFIEVGTVTPKAPAGQPQAAHVPPAEAKDALINRLGFNNEGLDAFLANVQRARSFRAGRHPGPEHRQERRHRDRRRRHDYLAGLDGVYPHADYVTVNISSPNTRTCVRCRATSAGVRCWALLQQRAPHWRATRPQVPMFVKIAPTWTKTRSR